MIHILYIRSLDLFEDIQDIIISNLMNMVNSSIISSLNTRYGYSNNRVLHYIKYKDNNANNRCKACHMKSRVYYKVLYGYDCFYSDNISLDYCIWYCYTCLNKDKDEPILAYPYQKANRKMNIDV